MKPFYISAPALIILSLLVSCGNTGKPLSFEVINVMQPDSSFPEGKMSSVYVKNFSDNDDNWKAIEEYGKKKSDGNFAIETIYFIHDSSNTSPGMITDEQFKNKYRAFAIAEHHIISGVSHFRKYPFKGLEGF